MLEIQADWYPKLFNRCNEKKIKFLSTGFDLDSIDFLNNLGQDCFKIPSGKLHMTLLRKVAQKKPIILSTGMATLEDKIGCRSFTGGIDKSYLTILHCSTAYLPHLKK